MANAKVPSLSLPATAPTKLGPIFITPTEATHLHVSSRNGNDRNEGGLLTLRGCEYYVSAHYYRYKDGSFQIGPEFTEAQDSNGKRMRETNAYERRQSLYISNHAASESARNKLAEVLTTAVNECLLSNSARSSQHRALWPRLRRQDNSRASSSRAMSTASDSYVE